MVSVGVLAALINVAVLLTVAFADRALELIVRNFATSRLHSRGRAPVVHDSDTWLPNIPRSVVKYHRHPASELVTELGVDVSEVCSPDERVGNVITTGDSLARMTMVELGASAFLLQATKFLGGHLSRVPAGMPKNITGKECVECFEKNNFPDVMRSCRVELSHIYAPGQLNVSVRATDGPFKTLSDSFTETGGQKRSFLGMGDLTGNGAHRAIFVFDNETVRTGEKVLRYLEYGEQAHCHELKDQAVRNNGRPVVGITKAEVSAWEISCDVNELSFTNFLVATMVYRTIQLENPVIPLRFLEDKERFANISEDDVYRAALAMKIIDDTNSTGKYFVYSSCGVYNWKFLIPLIVCILVVAALGTVSFSIASRIHNDGVPYNSRSWYRHACDEGVLSKEIERANHSGYFDSVFEEMVVQIDSASQQPRIVFRSRPRSRQQDEVDRNATAQSIGREHQDTSRHIV